MNIHIITLLLISSLWILSGCGGGSGTTPTDASSGTPIEEPAEDPIEEPIEDPIDEPIDLDEQGPLFTTEGNISIRENVVIVSTVHAEDNATVSYSINGDDSAHFILDSLSGKLKFKTAPNFEAPIDLNQDNIYKITVTATDTSTNTSKLDMNITVVDIDESSSDDSDGDYIPDNIEILIESNSNDSDMNNSGVEDGLDTQGVYGDTFFDKLWHIRSLGTATNDSGIESIVGNDLNLLEIYHNYMGYNYGEHIIVQVVDTSIDTDHEDLEANMDLSRSYDGGNVGDPSGTHPHGTKVTGIMAARAFNGKGVRGIIPFAKIAGSNWLNTQRTPALEKAWLTGDGANEIAVSNNSWGSYYDTDTLYEDIMALGTSTLRDGKGRIYVFSAGNDRGTKGNANLQYALSNRYAIAVAGLKHNNTYSDYSTPGSNILVSGYSGNYYQDSPTIGTTTIMGTSNNSGDIDSKTTWSEDIDENYVYTMNGTSAASPTVAASIALVLEACPDLTWRDVKYLIAKHAKQIDSSNSTWVMNAADTPLRHSIDYGFGLINPQGMINDCTTSYINLPTEKSQTIIKVFNEVIPDDRNTYSFDLNITEDITVEWVEATIHCSTPYASDYRVELTSPEGTKTTLMTEDTDVEINHWMSSGFRMSTPAMLGEKSKGIWRVDMTDQLNGDTGTLNTIELKVYGH